ncbi:MAG: hypothetical protein Q9163_000653 [Psora crenata]
MTETLICFPSTARGWPHDDLALLFPSNYEDSLDASKLSRSAFTPMALPAVSPIPTEPQMSYEVEAEEQQSQKVEEKQRLWDWVRRLRRDEQTTPSNEGPKPDTPPQTPSRPGLGQRGSRKVGVGIPRSTTFTRQKEEHRGNLEPVEPTPKERRDVSKVRQRALSAQPNQLPLKKPRKETSAPDLGYCHDFFPSIDARINSQDYADHNGRQAEQISTSPAPPFPSHSPSPDVSPAFNDDAASQGSFETKNTLDEEILNELAKKWILNLSMQFRDKSPREKFFITYAELPQRWRRVTVSCDYRNVEIDSLESDLQSRQSQRDKSARIYESLRGSLGDIQFYDTVTNLKLETRDDRLHVHVTEDVNEIITYPSIRSVNHLQHVPRYKECELHFVEHMSGFVYKVDVRGNTWIKKEIPGPDSVDEFLYEINALSSLRGAKNVIEIKGLVLSEDEETVKGLLIAYAEKNALVDIIYDNQGNLPWPRRELWARQIIKGLSEIHEAGFVQGDFTLSNIVVDALDEVKIIDINRRGCPLGWEPPEIVKLIENCQRISMFIGIKSDLFQLGMVLWGLAMEVDEPERQQRPLKLDNAPEEIPEYFRALVAKCLDHNPAARSSATDLLNDFPASDSVSLPPGSLAQLNVNHFASTAIVQGNPENADSRKDLHAGDIGEVGRTSHPHPTPSVGFSPPDEVDMPGHSIKEMGDAPQNASDGLSPGREQSRQASSMLVNTSSTDQELSRPLLRNSQVFRNFHSDDTIPSRGRRTSEEEMRVQVKVQVEPRIVHISPSGVPVWEEVTMDGAPYLIRHDTLDPPDDEDHSSQQPNFHTRRAYHWSSTAADVERGVEHLDSGLGDMDLNTHLAGIGTHENLSFAARAHASGLRHEYSAGIEEDGDDAPEGTTDDLGGIAHEHGNDINGITPHGKEPLELGSSQDTTI